MKRRLVRTDSRGRLVIPNPGAKVYRVDRDGTGRVILTPVMESEPIQANITAERLGIAGPSCDHEDMSCPPGECDDLYPPYREDSGR